MDILTFLSILAVCAAFVAAIFIISDDSESCDDYRVHLLEKKLLELSKEIRELENDSRKSY